MSNMHFPTPPDRELELVFALAGPVGTDLRAVSRTLREALRMRGYAEVEEIDIHSVIRQIAARCPLTRAEGTPIRLLETPEEMRIASYMDAANAIRRMAGNPAAIASAAIAEIRGRREQRSGGVPAQRAYIVRSLNRPEEGQLLRRVYRQGFFLIGVNMSRPERVDRLARLIAESYDETLAEALAKRDEDEAADEYGQRLRDLYQLCDLFVSAPSLCRQIDRFVRLILGDPCETPCADEQFLFQAHAASLFSGALGRQAGAVLTSPAHEVLGIGWNGVPKGGGGLYRAGEHYDRREIHAESVDAAADELIEEMLETARRAGWLANGAKPALAEAREAFQRSRVMSLIELGRATHAEMEALLAAARIGVSTRGSTLYTTTFPCPPCTRAIVTAGVRRVVYIEPYPKSRALDLHRDSIHGYDDVTSPECGKRNCDDRHSVRLEPFTGIAPHRFQDLFSNTATGFRSAGVLAG